MMRNLRVAASFLTRVPVHVEGVDDITAATPWFPMVGALVGAAGGVVFAVAAEVVPHGVAAALALVATALITGAFHHDGLADIADAFGGGWTPEQRMAILKDSRHGTYGVVSLVLIGLVEWSALASLTQPWGIAALVAAHSLGRAAILAVLLLARPAPTPGMGADYSAGLSRPPIVAGLVAGAVVGGVALGVWSVVALVAVGVTSLAVVTLAHRKIGGFTGDVLGATALVGQAAVLVAASAAALRHVSPWWW